MPKQEYALDPGGPKRLVMAWEGMLKNITINLDGQMIGTIPGNKELKAGQQFTLPDGSQLSVQYVEKWPTPEMKLLRNGEPLPGSATSPETRLNSTASVFWFIGGMSILLGLIAVLFSVPLLRNLGAGWGSIIAGVVYLLLGFGVKRRSMIALIAGMLLFLLDTGFFFVVAVQNNVTPTGGAIMRVIFFALMWQGIGAIRELKRKAAMEAIVPAPPQNT